MASAILRIMIHPEAFQISRKLGLVHVEFFCVLVQQLCVCWMYHASKYRFWLSGKQFEFINRFFLSFNFL